MPKNGIDFGGMIDRLFPAKYDFMKMLEDQAVNTILGTDSLLSWMLKGTLSQFDEIEKIDASLDDLRHKMEYALIEAFTTPFDRREIYSIAHQMGEISDFIVSTHVEMMALQVKADEPLIRMTQYLKKGLEKFAESLRNVQSDPSKAEALIHDIRKMEHEIEHIYIDAFAQVVKSGDAMDALRRREIYHHMKDASRAMGTGVDILHRIVVSIS